MLLDNHYLAASSQDAVVLNKLTVLVNLLLLTIPMALLLWIPGVWLVFGSIIVCFLIAKRHIASGTALKKLYTAPAYRALFWVHGGYVLFSLICLIILDSPLKSIDNALIFLLWLSISPLLCLFKPNTEAIAYGCLFTVSIALITTLIHFYWLHEPRPFGLYGTSNAGSGAIKLADIALLLGLLALILFSATTGYKRYLGILALSFGLTICLYAQVRGGLLALLLCALLRFAFKPRPSGRILLFIILFVSTLGIATNKLMDNALVARSDYTWQSIPAVVLNNQLNNSLGVRLELWRAAVSMFTNRPLLGVGLNRFDDVLQVWRKKHLVSEQAGVYAHAHNEYFCALATGGIIGFSLTLLLFLVPLYLFYQDYHRSLWAQAGFWSISLISGFALTDCVFDRRMTVLAFIIIISICLAGTATDKQTSA